MWRKSTLRHIKADNTKRYYAVICGGAYNLKKTIQSRPFASPDDLIRPPQRGKTPTWSNNCTGSSRQMISSFINLQLFTDSDEWRAIFYDLQSYLQLLIAIHPPVRGVLVVANHGIRPTYKDTCLVIKMMCEIN